MGVDVSELHLTSDTDLVKELTALEIQMRQTYAHILRVCSEIDTRGIATTLGYSNTAALLLHTSRITSTDAKHRLAQAEVLHATVTPTGSLIGAALPQTAAALARGEIGPEHVDVIHKTLKDLPHLDPETRVLAEKTMLEQAAEHDPNALARFGWHLRDLVDPDGPPPVDNEPKRPDRELHRRQRRDGSWDYKIRLDPINGALMNSLTASFEKMREANDDRGHAERAGDAFVDLLKKAANCPDLPTHNGRKTEMTLTVSLDFLHRALNDALLPGQSYLTARDVRLAACDAHILPAVMDGDSKPLDIAVPAYVVPTHIRRAVVLRDRGCAFPGCARPASTCDAHHIVEWLQGGPTEVANLIMLCQIHHRLVHHSDWQVKLVNNTAWFTPPAYVDPARKPRRNYIHRIT